jgi:hypothetical protein
LGQWQGTSDRIERRASGSTCAACGHREHVIESERAGAYAYLLGLYLGDGCISPRPKGVFRLRISLDARYSQIVEECEAAIRAVMPGRSVARVHNLGCVEVGAYSKACRACSRSMVRDGSTIGRSACTTGSARSSTSTLGRCSGG